MWGMVKVVGLWYNQGFFMGIQTPWYNQSPEQSTFSQNEEIYVQIGELEELDRITYA